MKICACIILYEPDKERLKSNIAAIEKQVDEIFLIDNGSSNVKEIEMLNLEYNNVSTIFNKENYGIAYALNQACRKAKSNGYDWILTLDQDSVCPENMVQNTKKYLDIEHIGIVAPRVFYEGWHNKDSYSSSIEEVNACMTSASLTNISAWEKVGGFCEEYFIDYVDNEFCMKLRIHGFKILRNNKCIFHHQLGVSKQKKILGYHYNYSIHSPQRVYYMTRNNLMFIKQYSMYISCFKEYLKLIYVILSNIVFSDEKFKTLKYILLGINDYKKKKLGKCEWSI